MFHFQGIEAFGAAQFFFLDIGRKLGCGQFVFYVLIPNELVRLQVDADMHLGPFHQPLSVRLDGPLSGIEEFPFFYRRIPADTF